MLRQSLIFSALTIFLMMPLNVLAEEKQGVDTLLAKGEFESALKIIERVLKDNKDNMPLHLLKGYTLVRLKKYEQGIVWYEELIKRWNKEPEPMNNLGMIYRWQGNYNKAIAMFNNTIKKFPKYQAAYENLGDTYLDIASNNYQRGIGVVAGDQKLIVKRSLANNLNALAKDLIQGKNQAFAAVKYNYRQGAIIDQKGKPILSRISNWLRDLSSQTPRKYFSHYSKEFSPAGDVSFQQWADKKKSILSRAAFMEISLKDINIEQKTPDTVIASFIQSYESNTLWLVSHKQLTLKKYPEGWLIIGERTIK